MFFIQQNCKSQYVKQRKYILHFRNPEDITMDETVEDEEEEEDDEEEAAADSDDDDDEDEEDDDEEEEDDDDEDEGETCHFMFFHYTCLSKIHTSFSYIS